MWSSRISTRSFRCAVDGAGDDARGPRRGRGWPSRRGPSSTRSGTRAGARWRRGRRTARTPRRGPRRAGVGPVDLVDHQDDGQVPSERLAQHEPGLRERALGGVDEQHDAVDHRERPLDLAAEVGVAGGVDDVERDVVVAALVVPHERGVLGEDRDALLALEVARVHDPFGDVLVGAEGAGLVQHRVDERGLAVVDVGDDRQVADVVAATHVRCGGGGVGIDACMVVERVWSWGHDMPRYRRFTNERSVRQPAR